MRRLEYLPAAQRDLAHIQAYIARTSGNITVRERFVAVLNLQCAKLASLPGTPGRARPNLLPDIRSFAFKNYVIFFRYTEATFQVVNIIEGHRDIPALFRGDEA